MKISLIVLILTSSLITNIRCDCHRLLKSYFNCKYLNFSIPEYGRPEFSGVLNDTFIAKELNQYQTVDQVMEFYRKIITENSDCNSEKCKCVNYNDDIHNAAVIFNNPDHLKTFTKIIQDIKNKHVMIADLDEPKYSDPILKFCVLNDYSFQLLHFYPKEYACLQSPFENYWIQECSKNGDQPIYGFNKNIKQIGNEIAVEKFLKCFFAKFDCDLELKRFYLVNLIMVFKYKIKGDLSEYIDYLIDSHMEKTVSRNSVWVAGDPQIYSVSKKHQACNFNTEVSCLKSAVLEINCTAKSSISSSATYLSSVTLRFTVDNVNYDYIADQNSFSTTFSNNMGIINDSLNNRILEILLISKNKINIIDYVNRIAFSLGKWSEFYYFVLRAPKTVFTYGSGILVEGCPAEFTDKLISKRKRGASGNVNTDCAQKAQISTGDDVMNQDTVYNMCVHDCSKSNNISFADLAKEAADSVKQLKIADLALFGNHAAFIFVDKAIFIFISLNYFVKLFY